MQPYAVEATRATPHLHFDIGTGLLRIKGSSYPENASSFYQLLFDKVEEHLSHMDQSGQGRLHLDMEVIYLNSSSSKVFMMLFDLLDAAAAKGADVAVHWRFHPENESALECGREFKEDLRHLPFALLESDQLPVF